MNDFVDPPPSRRLRPQADDRVARLTARSAERRQAIDGSARQPASRPSGNRGRSGGRRHAARGSRIAALALSAFSTLGLGAFLKEANASSSTSAIPLATVPATTSGATTTTSGATATRSTTPTSSAPATSTTQAGSAGLRDGTFTGSASANRYGDVQVQVVVSNGKVTSVNIVQYPDRDGRSVEINNRAIPQLVSETLRAQSASVDSVSGATYTSQSYRQSMQSAIDQARSGSAAT